MEKKSQNTNNLKFTVHFKTSVAYSSWFFLVSKEDKVIEGNLEKWMSNLSKLTLCYQLDYDCQKKKLIQGNFCL